MVFQRFGFVIAPCLLAMSLQVVGCVEDENANDLQPPKQMAEGMGKSLLGSWESRVDSVVITADFTGTATAGNVTTVQSAQVGGDTPTCRSEYVGIGTFTVSETSLTIAVSDAKIRTLGCSFPDSENPGDRQSAMNFAGALSGPFELSETQLRLGNAYPIFTRK